MVTRLAYLRHRGAYYNPSEARKAARIKLIEWAKVRGLWHEDSAIIGVCPDNPAVTPPDFCQYDVGIAVEDGVDEDELVSIQTLPESHTCNAGSIVWMESLQVFHGNMESSPKLSGTFTLSADKVEDSRHKRHN